MLETWPTGKSNKTRSTALTEILSILGLLLWSGLKFFTAPPIMAVAGYTYWETIMVTTLGGFLGVLFFYFLTDIINKYVSPYFQRKKKGDPKKFTRKNKLIIKAKWRFGLLGLSFLTPSLLSIPLGTMLAAKYFRSDRKTIPYLLMSVVFWSFTLTTFYFYVKPIFNDHIKPLFV